ncbi:MAG: hypothetical protein IPP15_04875 [Saprospiraceae bacterium]|uniref:Outer membrane protein beta-barrel domain-containing protein n=1 Tax=Candidatus Opimibacter skivensis TaxID=2982028 RepID=A0A9D7XP82_9BACT|nr:hypothetical protein [Candidatus Opimibacter skivensis]
MKILISLLFVFLSGYSNFVFSQETIGVKSSTKGFSIGGHGAYLSYTASSLQFEPHTGYGFGGYLQYGFTHQIAVALNVQHYWMDPKTTELIKSPYPYTEIDLIGKYIFGSTNSPVRPFLSLGGNYSTQEEMFYDISDPNLKKIDATYSGFTACGGAGINFFLTPRFTIDLSGLYHLGAFGVTQNGTHYDATYDFTAFKFLGGFSYHF